MGLGYYLDLSVKVLTDARVIAIALAVFAASALLRYVAVITSRRGPTRRRPPSAKKTKAGPAPGPEITEE